MAHYDPETLIILRKVLDDAWAALPEGSKCETLKSDMAQRIRKQARTACETRSDFELRPSLVP